jgi:hypothetical protein
LLFQFPAILLFFRMLIMAAIKFTFSLLALASSVLAIPMPDAGAGSFVQQNGEDAIALNEGFASLTPDSSCTTGTNACISNQFAQCVGGKFVLTPCGTGTICVALPLVNSRGTSITCSTTADRDARIAATGATGAGSSTAADNLLVAAPDSPAPAPVAPPAAGGKSFQKQNGLDAQALNKKFATLTAESACNPGENACVGDAFAQCVNGKFVLTSCAGGLRCAALPLVNSPGTSITCVDTPQAIQRIADSGAGNSLTGN